MSRRTLNNFAWALTAELAQAYRIPVVVNSTAPDTGIQQTKTAIIEKFISEVSLEKTENIAKKRDDYAAKYAETSAAREALGQHIAAILRPHVAFRDILNFFLSKEETKQEATGASYAVYEISPRLTPEIERQRAAIFSEISAANQVQFPGITPEDVADIFNSLRKSHMAGRFTHHMEGDFAVPPLFNDVYPFHEYRAKVEEKNRLQRNLEVAPESQKPTINSDIQKISASISNLLRGRRESFAWVRSYGPLEKAPDFIQGYYNSDTRPLAEALYGTFSSDGSRLIRPGYLQAMVVVTGETVLAEKDGTPLNPVDLANKAKALLANAGRDTDYKNSVLIGAVQKKQEQMSFGDGSARLRSQEMGKNYTAEEKFVIGKSYYALINSFLKSDTAISRARKETNGDKFIDTVQSIQAASTSPPAGGEASRLMQALLDAEKDLDVAEKALGGSVRAEVTQRGKRVKDGGSRSTEPLIQDIYLGSRAATGSLAPKVYTLRIGSAQYSYVEGPSRWAVEDAESTERARQRGAGASLDPTDVVGFLIKTSDGQKQNIIFDDDPSVSVLPVEVPTKINIDVSPGSYRKYFQVFSALGVHLLPSAESTDIDLLAEDTDDSDFTPTRTITVQVKDSDSGITPGWDKNNKNLFYLVLDAKKDSFTSIIRSGGGGNIRKSLDAFSPKVKNIRDVKVDVVIDQDIQITRYLPQISAFLVKAASTGQETRAGRSGATVGASPSAGFPSEYDVPQGQIASDAFVVSTKRTAKGDYTIYAALTHNFAAEAQDLFSQGSKIVETLNSLESQLISATMRASFGDIVGGRLQVDAIKGRIEETEAKLRRLGLSSDSYGPVRALPELPFSQYLPVPTPQVLANILGPRVQSRLPAPGSMFVPSFTAALSPDMLSPVKEAVETENPGATPEGVAGTVRRVENYFSAAGLGAVDFRRGDIGLKEPKFIIDEIRDETSDVITDPKSGQKTGANRLTAIEQDFTINLTERKAELSKLRTSLANIKQDITALKGIIDAKTSEEEKLIAALEGATGPAAKRLNKELKAAREARNDAMFSLSAKQDILDDLNKKVNGIVVRPTRQVQSLYKGIKHLVSSLSDVTVAALPQITRSFYWVYTLRSNKDVPLLTYFNAQSGFKSADQGIGGDLRPRVTLPQSGSLQFICLGFPSSPGHYPRTDIALQVIFNDVDEQRAESFSSERGASDILADTAAILKARDPQLFSAPQTWVSYINQKADLASLMKLSGPLWTSPPEKYKRFESIEEQYNRLIDTWKDMGEDVAAVVRARLPQAQDKVARKFASVERQIPFITYVVVTDEDEQQNVYRLMVDDKSQRGYTLVEARFLSDLAVAVDKPYIFAPPYVRVRYDKERDYYFSTVGPPGVVLGGAGRPEVAAAATKEAKARESVDIDIDLDDIDPYASFEDVQVDVSQSEYPAEELKAIKNALDVYPNSLMSFLTQYGLRYQRKAPAENVDTTLSGALKKMKRKEKDYVKALARLWLVRAGELLESRQLDWDLFFLVYGTDQGNMITFVSGLFSIGNVRMDDTFKATFLRIAREEREDAIRTLGAAPEKKKMTAEEAAREEARKREYEEKRKSKAGGKKSGGKSGTIEMEIDDFDF